MTYFAFRYFGDRFALARAEGPWVTFFDGFIDDLSAAPDALDAQTKPLFSMYMPDRGVLGPVEPFTPADPPRPANFVGVRFDAEKHMFRAWSEDEVERGATAQESLIYCDVQACSVLSLDGLKLRLLEMSYGFIPSFQYRIERHYRSHFEPYVATISDIDETFDRKTRKDTFSALFDTRIIPALAEHGFERDTPRSMRLVKRCEDVAVFVLFEHISFGSGAYQVSVVWTSDSSANFDDECAIGELTPRFPYHTNLMIGSRNRDILAYGVEGWLRVFELYVTPFISRHLTLDDVRRWLDADRQLIADKATLACAPMSPPHSYSLVVMPRVVAEFGL